MSNPIGRATPQEEALARFERRLRAVWKPDDGGDIVDWLEENIKSIPFSPMPSGFLVGETPWLKEVLRSYADPEVFLTQVIAPIQSGKSLSAEMLSCYILARQPAPTLYLNDSNENATDWLATRLRVLWDNTPAVKNRLPAGEIGKKNTTVQTDSMTFWCLGQKEPSNLQRRSIRWLVGDETWLWKKGNIKEALARVTSFGWLGKAILMSQGGFDGDETHELWETTTKHIWSFACPQCGHRQHWSWDSVRLPEEGKLGNGDWDYQAVNRHTVYECEGCKHHFPDNLESRMAMNATGFYWQTNPNADSRNRGYKWNALCARSWGKVAEMRLRAEAMRDLTGDSKSLQIWKQKQMADFWSDEPDAWDISQVVGEYRQGEEWEKEARIEVATKRLHSDHKAEGCIFARFMTVDVQRNGFYCRTRSWAEGGDSRGFRWRFVPTWADVKAFQDLCGVHKALVFVDCGDQFDDVIRQCGIHGWTALRGDQRSEFAWRVQTPRGMRTLGKTYAPARLMNVGTGVVRVHHFSNLALKDQLSRLRKMGKHTCAADDGQEYFEQMDSEVRVITNTGRPEWRRIGKRANHLWDCEVMQLVPAMAFGLLAVQPKPLEAPKEGDEAKPEEPPAEQI